MAKGKPGEGTTKRRRTGGVSLATRLAGATVIVSFAALGAATIVGINSGLTLGREIYEDRLVSLNNSGQSGMAAAINSAARASDALALSPSTASAVEAFDEASIELRAQDDFDVTAERRQLVADYSEIYADVFDLAPDELSAQSLAPRSPEAVYLQMQYSVVPNVERVAVIDDAQDGSTWSAVHADVHPGFRRVVDELRLTDLYLIEPVDERIVYSVEKGIDLGTSLSTGPFSGSILANTVSQVIEDPGAGSAISDLGFYDPVPGTPVGVYASPIFDNGDLVGVLALLYDGPVLTQVATNDQDWDAAGFDESADLYFFGDDGTVRTDPRAYLEDPVAFLDASEASGALTEAERTAIELLGTTVLVLRATDATLAAVDSGAGPVDDGEAIDSTEVFATVTRFDTPTSDIGEQLDWAVVAQIDVEEAEASIINFRNLLVVGTAVFLIITAFVAVAWANRTMAPVRAISDRLGDPDRDDGPLELPDSSPLEFHYLAASFEQMTALLRRQHSRLAIAREERLQLMQQMLPPAVAERVASGDLDELDHISQASVAVVVILGLGELVHREGVAGSAIVEALHSELDGLAEQHGLDRIKVVGDAYFASCGHDRPYIDHAPRVVMFATDTRDAVEEFGRRTEAGLDTAIGVHTGPVTIGMVGEDRMIFDVWGDTVSYAHLLARRAEHNTILVSDRTHDMLPDELVTEQVAAAEDTTWSVPLTTVGGVG